MDGWALTIRRGIPKKVSELGVELMVFDELSKSLSSIYCFSQKKGLPLHHNSEEGEAISLPSIHLPINPQTRRARSILSAWLETDCRFQVHKRMCNLRFMYQPTSVTQHIPNVPPVHGLLPFLTLP